MMKKVNGLNMKQVHPCAWRLLLTLVFVLGGLMFFSQTVHAEGSVDLIDSGGHRPYLYYNTAMKSGFPLFTVIRVYAREGETINLGSSANGINKGRILYTSPTGVAGMCATTAPNGRILNRSQEVAGPLPNAGGYTPCVVTVGTGQGGIWEIRFTSPRPDLTTITVPPNTLVTANWKQPSGVSYISAWDITVRDASGNAIPGRAYANYLTFYLGNANASFSPELYVQTEEGYNYFVHYKDARPQLGAFYANDWGLVKTSTGAPIYRSIEMSTAAGGSFWELSLPSGIKTDISPAGTQKLFFNTPDFTNLPEDAPLWLNGAAASTWLNKPPVLPVAPNTFAFTGNEGTPGQAGTNPMGGYFTFDSNIVGGYEIKIDLNQDGTYGNSNDAILVGSAQIGLNTVPWDGLDGAGNPVPAGPQSYGVRIKLRAGEVHFPYVDVESNPGGLIIQRLRPTTVLIDPYLVYYNDSGLGGAGAPVPISALDGISSQDGAQKYTLDYGNKRLMDTWTLLETDGTMMVGGLRLAQADLEIIKTHTPEPVTAGSIFTYTLTVINHGPSDVSGAKVADTFPAEVLNPSWTCAITGGTGSCAAPGPVVGNINTTLDLNVNAVATFTITATLSPKARGVVTNTATVTRPPDVRDPNLDNNIDSDPLTVVVPKLSIQLVKTADPTSVPETGGAVTFTFQLTNTGETTATLDSLTDTVFGNLNGQGTCSIPQTLPVNGIYTCSLTRTIAGDYGVDHTNVATVAASDTFGNHATSSDDAMVTFTDVLPQIQVTKKPDPSSLPEPGGQVTYTITIQNLTAEPLRLTSLVDDKFGDLTAECKLPVDLPGLGQFTCLITRSLTGNAPDVHVNTVTATGQDDEGNQATANATAQVTFTSLIEPQIKVEKTPNTYKVLYTGGEVTYEIRVYNLVLEPLVLTSLVDDKFGDLSAECNLPVNLAPMGQPGDQYPCYITRTLSGPAGEPHVNTVTATAHDAAGKQAVATAQASVCLCWYGRTANYWKCSDNFAKWPAGYSPSDTVRNLFNVPSYLIHKNRLDLNGNGKDDTLLEALNYFGDSSLEGAAQILLRAGVAAVLNEATFGPYYPYYDSVDAIKADVEVALASQNIQQMLKLAKWLDLWNNGYRPAGF